MINFNYQPGLYDIKTTVLIETVPYYADDKGWFPVNSGKIKGDSTFLRLVSQRNGIVSHSGVIDWESTFFFLKADIYDAIDEIARKNGCNVTDKNVYHTVKKYKVA